MADDPAPLTLEQLNMVAEPAPEPAPEPAKAEPVPEPAKAAAEPVKEPVAEPAKAEDGDKAKPAEPPKTLLAEPGEGEEAKGEGDKAPAWPDDWRDKLAGDDKKLRARLERFTSPKAILESYLNIEKTAKQAPKPLGDFPAEGTDEEKTAWRTAQGVPVAPSDYLKDFSLSDGLVIGDNDKPAIEEVLSVLHEDNVPVKNVQSAINAYYQMREKQMQQLNTKDSTDMLTARDELRDEFGKDFMRNMTAAYTVIPDDIRGDLMEARMPDGTKFGNHPQILRWLTKAALEINPAATFAPGNAASSIKGVETRIAEIEGYMRTDVQKYQSKDVQDEYVQLLDLREKMQSKQKAA